MRITLPPDIESPILAAVHSGRYASLDDAMTEAASMLAERLKQEMAEEMEGTRRAVGEMKAGLGRPAAEMLADMQRMIDEKRRQ